MYEELSSPLPYVVAWQSVTPPGAGPKRIVPDGCLDIIWRDGTVFVAGPDTTAQVEPAVPGSRYAALRFGAGTGPGVWVCPPTRWSTGVCRWTRCGRRPTCGPSPRPTILSPR
ncbi:hypothetical protein GCM10029963_77990 [Micromonospora andamanensis]